jgi:pimeloyl-ACP methyl ester carboxylesterase
MGAIAAVLFALAFFIHGSGTTTNVWFDPTSLMLAGLACLALHLLGVGKSWYSHRRR